MNKQTVLLTGGCGFIGTNFILDWFLNKRGKLINLDKVTYAGKKNKPQLQKMLLHKPYKFIKGDINNIKLLKEVLKEHKPSAVIHMAAESHVDRSITNPNQFIKTNILGTYNLLEAAKDYWDNLNSNKKNLFRFLHLSTDEVYGTLSIKQNSFNEKSPYLPNSPYSASKASSDHLVISYYKTYGFPVIIINCSNNFGPFQNEEKFIPKIITHAIQNKSIPIFGKGAQIRDWIYVKDHIEIMNIILTKGKIGESYAIGGNQEISNVKLAKKICEIFDKIYPKTKPHSKLIKFVNDRLGHDFRYAVDSTKIKREFGWRPSYSLNNKLIETIKFYSNQY